MLDHEGWLPEAKRLRVGTKRRVPHDCGSGTVMIVEHQPDKFTAWCFRCSEGGVERKEPSLSDMVEARRREASDAALCHSTTLPVPLVTSPREWPKEARLWLYRAGFHDTLIQRLGIYYHPPTQRVVLPVMDGERVVYWQARAVMSGQVPKYMGCEVSKATVIPKYGGGACIVLTEDMLSAMKIGRVTAAWSLLGTAPSTHLVSKLVQDGRPVLVWLDSDTAGRRAASKLLHSLRRLAIPCADIVTDSDPKLLSRAEIAQRIERARCALHSSTTT